MNDKYDRQPPRGELMGNFRQLMEAGCVQAEMQELLPLFTGLMIATQNNPCNGCPVWSERGSTCGAYQKYHTAYRQEKAIEIEQKHLERAKAIPTRPRCSACGLTIRGPNHADGEQHKRAVAKKSK